MLRVLRMHSKGGNRFQKSFFTKNISNLINLIEGFFSVIDKNVIMI